MSKKQIPAQPILVIDDESPILKATDNVLRFAGFNNIVTCQDSREAQGLLSDGQAELVLLDLGMPHVSGEDLLVKISADHPHIPVIIVTGAMEVEKAVQCMQLGAFDYLVKPVSSDRLLTTINKAIAYHELKRENLALKKYLLSDKLERPPEFDDFITNHEKILALFQYMESIAPTSQPVLITGETGVGKELAARGIHDLSGVTGEFVAVNVAGLDDNVFSDTLFGHTKGAFTGADQPRVGLVETAAEGTLFLDEIGDLSPASQAKLLRLLQEGEYLPLGEDKPGICRARILTATNHDLRLLEQEGRFHKGSNFSRNGAPAEFRKRNSPLAPESAVFFPTQR